MVITKATLPPSSPDQSGQHASALEKFPKWKKNLERRIYFNVRQILPLNSSPCSHAHRPEMNKLVIWTWFNILEIAFRHLVDVSILLWAEGYAGLKVSSRTVVVWIPSCCWIRWSVGWSRCWCISGWGSWGCSCCSCTSWSQILFTISTISPRPYPQHRWAILRQPSGILSCNPKQLRS